MYYIALVHKDADSAYGLSFPDLPGCFSAADDHDDIIANALEALELYGEGCAELPPASDIATLTGDAEIAKELATGAFLISIPYIRNIGKSARVNITLDKGLLAAIDAAATQRKLTRSAFIAQAANREITG